MHLSRTFVVPFTASAIAVAAACTSSSAATVPPVINYGQYNTYASNQAVATVRDVPSGYTPVYLNTLGRHGSRAATGSGEIDSAIALWNKAKKANALTATGRTFGADATTVKKAQAKVGNGKLSAVGVNEWTAIGKRSVTQQRAFWGAVSKNKALVEFKSSSSDRAQKSGDSFFTGAKVAAKSKKLTFTVGKREETDKQLRLTGLLSAAGKKQWDKINSSSATTAAADSALETLYTRSFVKSMSRSSRVSEARDLWETVAIAPALVKDGAVRLDRYLPKKAADQLAYVNDAVAFYKYGPGLSGSNTSFKKAAVVLDDFYTEIDDRLFRSGKSMATFRFSHGETTMPFYALLRLNPQATTAKPFTYTSTAWSGDDEAKFATNIDWLVVAKGGKATKAAKQVLVTMRVNEHPKRFSAACKTYEVKPYWYDYQGLKKCLSRS